MANTSLRFRPATLDDLPHIVRMLTDDPLGSTRERFATPLPHAYLAAFDASKTIRTTSWS